MFRQSAKLKHSFLLTIIISVTSSVVTSTSANGGATATLTFKKSHAITDIREFYRGEPAEEGLFHRRIKRQTGNGLMGRDEQLLILQKHNERRRNEIRSEGVSNMEVMVSISHYRLHYFIAHRFKFGARKFSTKKLHYLQVSLMSLTLW